jgi:hypothetical protein
MKALKCFLKKKTETGRSTIGIRQEGANKLRVQSIGERFCLKRLGPRKRGKRFKDEGSQRKGRLHHADAGLVGCVSSSSDLG